MRAQAMEEAGLSVVDFVDVGIECTLRQLLEAGFFHADPHPGEGLRMACQGLEARGLEAPMHATRATHTLACSGNLLATKSGDLVYLDFGMMSEAPQVRGQRGSAAPSLLGGCSWAGGRPGPTTQVKAGPGQRPWMPQLQSHLPTSPRSDACAAVPLCSTRGTPSWRTWCTWSTATTWPCARTTGSSSS